MPHTFLFPWGTLHETMVQLERTVPRTYAALEGHQADRQSSVVDVKDNIDKKSISILIFRGSTHSYANPKIDDICGFKKTNHSKSQFIILAT